MKILYIHHKNLLEPNANNIQVINMCKAFINNNHLITLLIPYFGNKNEFINNVICQWNLDNRAIRIIGFKPFKLKSIFFSSFITFLVRITLSQKRSFKEYDLIFSRHITSYLSFRKYNSKIIFEIHNNYFIKYKLINKLLIKIIKNKKYYKSSILVCISYNLKNYWSNYFSEFNIISSHDGFDDKLFSLISGKTEARDKLNMPDNEIIVSYVGNLRPDREIENILMLAKACPNYQFYIIGGPNTYIPNYQLFAKENHLENIIFTGNIAHNQVPYYLYASDVLLALWSDQVPTINYCSPLKIFEYMASGRMIIAHEYPTIREVIKDGYTGFLVAPNNPKSLENTLKMVLNLPSEQVLEIESNAKKEAFVKYSWDQRARFILSNL